MPIQLNTSYHAHFFFTRNTLKFSTKPNYRYHQKLQTSSIYGIRLPKK